MLSERNTVVSIVTAKVLNQEVFLILTSTTIILRMRVLQNRPFKFGVERKEYPPRHLVPKNYRGKYRSQNDDHGIFSERTPEDKEDDVIRIVNPDSERRIYEEVRFVLKIRKMKCGLQK